MECPRCNAVVPEGEGCPVCAAREQPAEASRGGPWQEAAAEDARAAHDSAEAVAAAADALAGAVDPSWGTAARPGMSGAATAPDDPASGTAPGGQSDAPPAAAPTGIKANDVDTIDVVNANRAMIFRAATINLGSTPGAEKEKVAALLEITTEFLPDDRHRETLDAEEVARHARVLADDGLLLVSCVDLLLASAAVQAVVAALEPEPGGARLLSFDRLGSDQASITIYGLLQCEGDAGTGTVVVADAVSAHAQPFLDSFLGGHGAFSGADVRRSLRQRGLRLVCLAEPSRYAALTRAGEESEFTHWAVPFLRPFLRREFPDDHEALCSAILRQREEGRWSRDDAELWRQLRTLSVQGRLREVVEGGGVRVQPVVVDEQRPVHQTVLFTGAFFTTLSPADFDRVVTTLLGDATIPVPLPAAPGADGGPAPAAHRDKPLAQLWRECADRTLRECGLVVLRDPAAGHSVEFREPGTRDALRDRLEEEYPFHLHAAFSALHDTGLLFTGSDAVAASVVRATAHMVEGHPQTYGRDWVAGMLVVSRARTADTIPAWHVVRRFGELLRELSARPAVRELVQGVLDWLMGVREFDAVFALVKQLRFAPEFDAFRWLRQLIDRGDADARAAAYAFLHRELGAVGVQVYPTLHALAEWLPAEDDDPDRYSRSQRHALRLLLEYAVNTAAGFDPARYGERPVRYPLLATGADTAAADIRLLVRWLLHPGITGTTPDGAARLDMPRLVAALVAEWTLILFGPRASPARPGGAAPAPAEEVAPDAPPVDDAATSELVFTVLLEELAARTRTPGGRKLRRQMLDYWDEMRELHLPSPQTTRAEREELAWKRGLFRALVLRFRALQTVPATATPDTPTP